MRLTNRISLCWRVLCAKPGNLFSHADNELPPANDEMQALMNAQLKELILVFSTHGHSGFSASYAVTALEKLLRFKPLGPLTGEPSEWVDHGECKQNKRCSHVFIQADRFDGQAYDIDAVVFREPSGTCFTGRGSAQPITFPYTPQKIYVDVDDDGNPLNGWDRNGLCAEWAAIAKAGGGV